jgi:hypothetical protein
MDIPVDIRGQSWTTVDTRGHSWTFVDIWTFLWTFSWTISWTCEDGVDNSKRPPLVIELLGLHHGGDDF